MKTYTQKELTKRLLHAGFEQSRKDPDRWVQKNADEKSVFIRMSKLLKKDIQDVDKILPAS